MTILQHKNGNLTHSYYTLSAVAHDKSEHGFAAAWKSGDHTRLESLHRSGLVAACRGPRYGVRYRITEAGQAALAAIEGMRA